MGTMTTTESGSSAKIESRAGAKPARPWSSHRMNSSTSGRKKPNERRIVTDGGEAIASEPPADDGCEGNGGACGNEVVVKAALKTYGGPPSDAWLCQDHFDSMEQAGHIKFVLDEFGADLVTDGGQPRDFPRDGRRWPNSRPQGGRTRRDSRLKRHADWQAGVLVGLACAALIGLLWRLLR